jgi:hypothetical protein
MKPCLKTAAAREQKNAGRGGVDVSLLGFDFLVDIDRFFFILTE